MKLTIKKVSPYFLFIVLVFSIFFSLPFLNFDSEIPLVSADTTTSGFNLFTDMSPDLAPVGDNTWKEIDCSAYIPVGATGVILEVTCPNEFTWCDIRKKGSTDDWYKQSVITHNHKFVYVGVDEDRIFELKSIGGNLEVYIQGYTDDSVVFFDNAKDYQIVPTASWETVDVSADVPEGATGTIWKILGQNNQIKEVGVRHPDSTDNFHEDIRQWCYLLTGVNSAREIEAYIETTDMDHYLVGYTLSPITFNVNWDDISMVDFGSWEEIDVTTETSADANGIIVYMRKLNWDADDMSIRAKGSIDDTSTEGLVYMDGQEYACAELDSSQVFEGFVDASECDFYVAGYTEVGITYPVNVAVDSNSEFVQNSTIGWINVSVSHANGYGDISSIIATVNTTAGEYCNLTWTQSGNTFVNTYDPLDMCILFSATSESSLGGNFANISFNVAFKRGTTGYCDVIIFSTAIDDYTDSDTFTDEFYLSDFLRATGLQWSKFLGDFYGDGTDTVAMDDTGNYVAVGTHYTQDIFIYNSTGDLQRTFDVHTTNYTSDFYVEMSGDGNYVMFTVRKTPTIWNFTVFERATGIITYTEQMTGGLAPVGLFISSNYNASLIALTNFPNMVKLYNYAGYLWNATTMNGVALPTIQWVSTSRTGDVIASGTTGDGVNWDNASVFMWNSGSSEPVWVWNSSVATSGVHDVEVSDTGEYICAIVSSSGYASDIIIFDSSSSSPLHEEQLPHIRTWSAKFSMDFVAEIDRTDEFYIVTTGDWDLNDNIVFCCKYNVTSDAFTTLWTYREDVIEFANIELSSIMHNDRYYFFLNGEGGVYYFDTVSNSTIWTYWNATKDYWYSSRINRDGNRFFVSTSIITGSVDNHVDYFGYGEEEIPFFVGSINVTNMEGCGNWIFSDERFYNFQGVFSHVIDATMLDHVGLRFTDNLNTFYLWYNVSARSDPNIDSFDLIVSPQFDADKDPGIMDSTISTATYDDGELTVVWKFMPTSFSFDAMDIDVYAFMNDTSGTEIGWALEESDLFHLYVLGGFTNSTNIGDAGQYQGRTPLDLYAGDNSSVLVEVYYRKLDQVHLQYGIWMPDAYVGDEYNYTLDIGMDFCFYGDDTWYKGWKTSIQQHGGGSTATNRWINYTTEHYRYNPTGSGQYEPMRQGKMYAYWEGYLGGKDQYQLYTDLWFSASNRSRMWGIRVNSVYHGMVDDALFGLPWLFGSNWRTLDQNMTDLTHKDNIMDYGGAEWGANRFTTEIVMCRFWMNLSRPYTQRSYYVRVQGYSSQDFNRREFGQFVGIDDPPIVPTTVPDIDSGGGVFGGLFVWLRSLGSFIVEGLTVGIIAGWGMFVSFLDMIFSLAGWEGGFSIIVSWVGSLLGWIITGVTYLFNMLTTLFTLMSSWLVLGITQFVALGSGLVTIYDNFVWIYAEAQGGWVDISEIVTPLLPLLPLAYFIWLFNSDDVEGMFRKVKMSWDITRSIVGFFIQIGQYTIQLISSVIEAVPIAE